MVRNETERAESKGELIILAAEIFGIGGEADLRDEPHGERQQRTRHDLDTEAVWSKAT